MTGVIATLPKFQFSNALGLPMSGGTLTSYLAGTTTPATTYQDEALGTTNTNPITLDSRGECTLWLDSTNTYKFVLKNALGVVQWTVDNITNSMAAALAFDMQLRADLAASSGSSLVGYMPAGAGAGATTVQSKLRESVSVKDFGAVGDGVTDDTAAIQAAINAVKTAGHGGSIYFPKGKYRITDTIEVSDLRGVRFIGDMGTVNNGPTIADGVNDSKIFWDGTNNTDPIFYFRRGHNNTFEHLCISGMKGSDATYRAYAGVWIDENHENYRFYDCKIHLCAIGIRVCSSFNHSTLAWTPGYSAYDAAYSAGAESVGGYQSDNGHYRDCSFGYNSIAGVSIESAQALDMLFDKCLFNTNAKSVHISACQGVQFNSPTFLAGADAEIYTTASASTGNIVVIGAHQEQGASILFECSNSSAALGSGILFQSCGGGDINIRGVSGTVVVKGSTLRTVSMKSANVSLVVEDSRVTSLDKTAALGNGPLLRLSNTTVTTTLSSNALAYDALDISKTTFPSWTNLAKVAQRFSSQGFIPDLMLGPITAGSTAGGMDGVAVYAGANSCIISYGAHFDESGNWIATATAGGNISLGSQGVTVNMFTGATVGLAPTFVEAFKSRLDLGTVLPYRTSDPSATPGTMYYNSSTGKVRIRDSVGWRDF